MSKSEASEDMGLISIKKHGNYKVDEDKTVNNHNETVVMKKTIGLLNSITIIVGSIIGSGIFVSPTGIIANVHSVGASLIIWVACGVFSLFGAYCYAELGTMIHRSGGDYIYVHHAFGPFLGFLRLWVEVMVARPASIAILSITFAEYILQPIFPDCVRPGGITTLLAVCCVLLIGFVNAFSVRISTLVQDVFTCAKLAALLLIIITGFVRIGMGHYSALMNAFEDSDWSPNSLTRAFYVGAFAYSGWNYLNCMIEEMNNPRRDLPIAIVTSCVLVTAIYTMANIAYITVVTPVEMLHTPAVAVTFAQRMYGVMWWIIPMFVAFSTFGGVNGTVMTTSRIFFVASQVNQMPSMLCFLHMDRFTPIVAVIFTCIISIIYIVVGDIYALITYMGFVQLSAIGLCVAIVIIFRVTRKNTPRGVKAPIIFAIIYIVVTLLVIIFAFVAAPSEALMGCVIILTGIPVYLIGCVWENKPLVFQRKFATFTRIVQKVLRLVPTN